MPGVPLSRSAFASLQHMLTQKPGCDVKFRETRADRILPRKIVPLDPTLRAKSRNAQKQNQKRWDEELRGERWTQPKAKDESGKRVACEHPTASTSRDLRERLVCTCGARLLNEGRPVLVHLEIIKAHHELPWRGRYGEKLYMHNRILKATPNVAELARRLGMELELEAAGVVDEDVQHAAPPAPSPEPLYPSVSIKKYPSLRTDPFVNHFPLGTAPDARAAAPKVAPSALQSDPPCPPSGGREPSDSDAPPMQAKSHHAARDAAPRKPEKTREAGKGTRANGVPLLEPIVAAWLALGLPLPGKDRALPTLARRFNELRESGRSDADAVQALHDCIEARRQPTELDYLRRIAERGRGVPFACTFKDLPEVLERAHVGRSIREARELERQRDARELELEREYRSTHARRARAEAPDDAVREFRELASVPIAPPAAPMGPREIERARQDQLRRLHELELELDVDEGAAE